VEINAQIYVHLTHCLVANTLQIYLQAAFTLTVGWTAAYFPHAKYVLIANFVQDILFFLWGGALEFVQKQHFFLNYLVGAMIKPTSQ